MCSGEQLALWQLGSITNQGCDLAANKSVLRVYVGASVIARPYLLHIQHNLAFVDAKYYTRKVQRQTKL